MPGTIGRSRSQTSAKATTAVASSTNRNEPPGGTGRLKMARSRSMLTEAQNEAMPYP